MNLTLTGIRVHAWGGAPCVHPVKVRLMGGLSTQTGVHGTDKKYCF